MEESAMRKICERRNLKKPILLFFMSVVFICICCGNSTRADAADVEEKEYIVVTKSDAYYDTLTKKYDMDTGENTTNAESLRDNHIAFMTITEKEATHIRRERGVAYLEENISLKGNGSSSETEELHQWNLDAIHLNGCKEGDDRIKIALVDSGVSYSEDIPVEERVCFIPEEEEISKRYEDASGHGTAMAGIIAARDNEEGITGIAPNSLLYSLRVLDRTNTCTLGRLVDAIYWAIDNDMDIINLSLGTDVDSAILHQAIADAYAKGCIVVAAAGNEENSTVAYPAAYPEVIAVGATNASGELVSEYAKGDELEILAPGKNIVSNSFFDGIMAVDGSSISAAQVTGAAALLWSKDRSVPADCIRQLLCGSTREVGSAQAYGAGLLDISCAAANYRDFVSSYQGRGGIVPKIQNDGVVGNYEDDIMVNGLWITDNHETMSKEITNGVLTEAQVKLAVAAAREPDKTYSNKANNNAYAALHGGGNYVLHLKYLYYFAKHLRGQHDGKTTVADIDAADLDAYDRCSGSPALTNTDAKKQLDNLRECTMNMLRDDLVSN